MELVLKRLLDDHETTGGSLYIDGVWYCQTVEDPHRHEKVPEKTRIAAGRYEIKLREVSPMAQRYEAVYETAGMLWLQDVPNFTYIYLHIGTDAEDSFGCILVGEILHISATGIKLVNSTSVYKKLHGLVTDALSEGSVFITILDN